jgi:tRNA dimethylallyltransferase
MALATRAGASIVSADSRQVYTGFDIGTAKPDAAERARVPHYGLDVAAPGQRYSAADWAGSAESWIAQIASAGRKPLIVGGTGFYVRALFNPLFDAPELDAARRGRLDAALWDLPVSELRRWCATLDPARAHLGRTQLLRAIETALLTGERLSDMHKRSRRPPATSSPRYLVVDPGPALAARLTQRIDAMLRAGWIDEVQRLAATVPDDAPAWSATGYDALRDVVRGVRPLIEARAAIEIATRQYAKRQRTWWRHQLGGAPVMWLNPEDPDAPERAFAWLQEEER